MKKRILEMLLALLMVFSLLPVTALANGDAKTYTMVLDEGDCVGDDWDPVISITFTEFFASFTYNGEPVSVSGGGGCYEAEVLVGYWAVEPSYNGDTLTDVSLWVSIYEDGNEYTAIYHPCPHSNFTEAPDATCQHGGVHPADGVEEVPDIYCCDVCGAYLDETGAELTAQQLADYISLEPIDHHFVGSYVIGTGEHEGQHGQYCFYDDCTEIGDWYPHDFSKGDCICGAKKPAPAHTHTDADGNVITFQPWESDNSLPGTDNLTDGAGSFYLTKDVTLNDTWSVTGTVNLCLNGKSITQTAETSVITVAAGATLNLYDCGTTKHYFTVAANGLWTLNTEATSGTALSSLTARPAAGTVVEVPGGVITGGSAPASGTAGGVHAAGTVVMNGGSIVGNETVIKGGGVYISNTGKFTLNEGAAILGNVVTVNNGGGGGVCVNGGMLEMNGGRIAFNYTPFGGGGVFIVTAGSTTAAKPFFMTMTGGEIAYNKAGDKGGGVCTNRPIQMSGGSIKCNTTALDGGGVRVTGNGSFTMTAGEISGNTATGNGGGVDVGGPFTMTGGKISGNTAAGTGGGGVYVGGTFTMTGGEITGNTSTGTGTGGGVFVNYISNKPTTIGGTAKITGNVQGGTITDGVLSGGTANNLYLISDWHIVLGTDGNAPADTMQIGVTLGTTSGTGVFTDATATDAKYVKCFTPDNTDYLVVQNSDSKLELVSPSGALGNVLSTTDALTADDGIDGLFTVAPASGDTPAKITLLRDFTTDTTLTVGGTKILDLNGKVINRNGGNSSVITVKGDLTLIDSSEAQTGEVTGGNAANGGGVFVDTNGKFTMSGGAITNCTATASSIGGGGVYVDTSAEFTMSGNSKISGCKTTYSGGSIAGGVYNKGTFEMTGGTIENCESTSSGGGIFNETGSTLSIGTGAVISDCWAKDNGGGVYLRGSTTTFTMTGGSITGNTAGSGGGVSVNDGSFTMTGGEISGNKSTSDRYFGGGVNYWSGTVTLGGTAVIKDNHKVIGGSETANNLYLCSTNTVTVSSATALASGAEIYVSTATAPAKGAAQDVTKNGSLADCAYFHSDVATDTNGNIITALFEKKAESGNAIIRLGVPTTKIGDATYSSVQTAVWSAGTTESTVTMTDDSTESVTVPTGAKITLDLNGKVLKGTGSGSVIKVNSGAELTVTDSGAETAAHYYTVGSDGLWTLNTAATEGTALSSLTARPATNDVIKVPGGAITGGNASNGGGVYVSGTFNMNGGSIVGNTTTGNGGGVNVDKNCVFTMSGESVISGNVGNYGAGVSSSGTFNMSGDSRIVGNTATTHGGGVYASNNNVSFTMSGNSKITGNKAAQCGGGVYVGGGSFTMSGGEISGNNAVNGYPQNNPSLFGGGVLFAGKTLTLGGTAKITDNKAGAEGSKTANNLDLLSDKTVTLGTDTNAPTSTMRVGVTTQTAPTTTSFVPITSASDTDYSAYFFADHGAPENVFRKADKTLYLAVPSITATGTGNPVFGTATDAYTVTTDGFGTAPTLKIEWKQDDTWSEAAPTGVTFADNKVSTTAETPAGSYEFRITNSENEFTSGTTANPKFITSAVTTLSVDKAAGSGSVTMTGWTYSETENAPVPTSATNGTNAVTYLYKVSTEQDTAYAATKPTDAGTYTVKATFATTANYKETTATADFTIEKATSTASLLSFAAPASLSYDGQTKSVTVAAATGITGLGEISVKYSSDGGATYVDTVPTNAGTYKVAVTMTEGPNCSATTAQLTDSSWTFTIDKATPAATDIAFTKPSDLIYDGQSKNATVTVEDGVIGLGEISFRYQKNGVDVTEHKAVGTYSVLVSVAEGDNYAAAELSNDSWTFKIVASANPALTEPTAVTGFAYTAEVKSLVTAGSIETAPVDGTKFEYALGENATTAPTEADVWSEDIPTGTDAGTYYVWYRWETDNYVGVPATCVSVEIAPMEIIITPDTDQKKTYGSSDPTLTYTNTELLNSDAFTGTLGRAAGEDFVDGGYVFTLGSLEVTPAESAGNYSLKLSDSAPIFMIEKKSITIKADNKGVLVGASKPDLTYTVTGLVGSDKMTAEPTLECTPDMNTAGEYPITVSGGSAGSNYTLSYENGTLTVVKRAQNAPKKGEGYEISAQGVITAKTDYELKKEGDRYSVRLKETETLNPSPYTAIDTTVTVNILAVPSGMGTVSGGGSYNIGESVTVTATPDSGYAFVEWQDISGAQRSSDESYTFTITKGETLIAAFKPVDKTVVQIPTLTNEAYTGLEFTGVDENADYTLNGKTKAIAAGQYTVTATLNDENAVWSDGTSEPKTLVWNIFKAPQTKPSVTVADKKITVTGDGENIVYAPQGSSEYTVIGGDNTTDELDPGTYYVYVKGDKNHDSSPITVVVVDKPTVTVKTLQPAYTETGVTFNGVVTPYDGNETYDVEFRLNGTPISAEPTMTDGVFTLNVTDLTPDKDYTVTAVVNGVPGETITFHTPNTTPPATDDGSISVTVESEIDAKVIVSVERGNDVIASWTSETPDTNHVADFDNLHYGNYNVVVRTNNGHYTETKMLSVEDGDEVAVSFTIPKGKLATVVEVKTAETPKTAVDGLGEILTTDERNAAATGSKDVEVKLEIEKKPERAVGTAANEIRELISKSGSGTVEVDFLDMSLFKTTTELDANGNATSIDTKNIGATNSKVIEIAIPYENNGLPKMFRSHNGMAETLKELSSRPTAPFVDGTYFVDKAGKCIFLYASGFSTYAIGYEEQSGGTPTGGGGGTGYSITGSDTKNGKVTLSRKNAAAGQTVTITVTPDAGYQLDKLTVLDKNSREIEVKSLGDNKFSFKMPSGKVTVSATFKAIEADEPVDEPIDEPIDNPIDEPVETGVCPKDESCPIAQYGDTTVDFWWHDGIHFCIENGLMQGVSGTEFNPNGTTTRAMIVTILWRLEGKPVVDYAMSFEDVPAGEWFAEAVRWAQSTGVVLGYSDKAFGPSDPITREQLAAILYRYADCKGVDVSGRADLAAFTDVSEINAWALENVKWANAVGLVQGRTTTTLVPGTEITRAEAATMIQRYCENVSGN